MRNRRSTQSAAGTMQAALPVETITPDGAGARLTCRSSHGDVVVVVPATPNRMAAKRWVQAVRRVTQVEVHLDQTMVGCRATGCSSRLPFVRSVPLALGLGLGELGVPVVVTGLDEPC